MRDDTEKQKWDRVCRNLSAYEESLIRLDSLEDAQTESAILDMRLAE